MTADKNFRSLAIQTSLIFRRFAGTVTHRDGYTVVKTPARPNFFWGNYLIFERAPARGDYPNWVDLFKKEIGPREQTGFMAFTWDDPAGNEGETCEFLNSGFTLSHSVVLTTRSVQAPPHPNPELVLRPLETNEDWEHYADIHFNPEWAYGTPENQIQFLKDEAKPLREMVRKGLGIRFGAFLGERPVAELGIYWDQVAARFSNVGTHRDFRRRGACAALVHHASMYLIGLHPKHTLVMEADPDYHAAKIYESLGFRPTQRQCEMQWCDPAKFPN